MNSETKVYLGNFNVCVFKEGCDFFIYLYLDYMFCVLKINNTNQLYMLNNNYISIENQNTNKHQHKTAIKLLNNFLEQFNSYKHIKIKLLGKGYKLKKSSTNSANLMINRAHITYVW